MIGLIAFGILIVWGLIAFGITSALFTSRKWTGKGWRFASIATLIFLLPFAEEIYIALSFRAHCAVYGGITELNPTATDRLTLSGGGRNAARILAHPAIDAVWIENNTDTVFEPKQFWLQITKEKGNCDADVTQRLFSVSRDARMLIKRDFCFNMNAFGSIPSITFGFKDNVEHKRFSILLPYLVKERRYDVLDVSDTKSKVLSSLSNFSVMPGYFRKAIWPHYNPYQCFKAGDQIGVSDFPYGNKASQFYEKAIVKNDHS